MDPILRCHSNSMDTRNSKPIEVVTYKLRIFEIKQDKWQHLSVKNAKPLLEKELINQTRFVLPSLESVDHFQRKQLWMECAGSWLIGKFYRGK